MIDNDQGDVHDSAPTPLTSIPSPVPPNEQRPPVTPFGIGIWVMLALFTVFVIRHLIHPRK